MREALHAHVIDLYKRKATPFIAVLLVLVWAILGPFYYLSQDPFLFVVAANFITLMALPYYLKKLRPLAYRFAASALLTSIVLILTHTAQGYRANRLIQEHLDQGDYESVITLLKNENNSNRTPASANQLARILTTVPKLELRDYVLAIELAKETNASALQSEHRGAAQDILACAMFANRNEEEAKSFARENRLDHRLKQFSVGKPCKEKNLYRAPSEVRTSKLKILF